MEIVIRNVILVFEPIVKRLEVEVRPRVASGWPTHKILPRRSLVVAGLALASTVLFIVLTLKPDKSPTRRSVGSSKGDYLFDCTFDDSRGPHLVLSSTQRNKTKPYFSYQNSGHASNYSMQKSLFNPPLRTEGRYIVDSDNHRFKLASINWYGASDVLFIPGGLEVQHRSAIAAVIRRLGFNSVRLPYSDELVLCNPKIPPHLVAANPDLIGKPALDVFEACVEALTDAGLAVIVNNHITHARWFDGFNLCDATWKNNIFGPLCRISQSEESWINNWEKIMSRFIQNPKVIGADLRNEIHGFWGTIHWSSWASAAEKASERLLAMQPNWLMFVEGLSSANDLSGVRKRPIKLSKPNRVVYSAHVYAWSGWGELDRFSSRTFSSFVQKMYDNWGYLLHHDIAPVWVGEFGAPQNPSKGDLHYWNNLMRYLGDVDADFGYWALNPIKPAAGEIEGYSILKEDWNTTFENDYRTKAMLELMP